MSKSIICSVAVCDRLRTKRDWCEGHYTRWRKTGDPGTKPLRPQKEHHFERGVCSVDGCTLEEHCKGYCRSHYIKLRKTGNAGTKPLAASYKSIDHGDGTRTCNMCDERKPLDEFYPQKTCRFGRRATCTSCVRRTGSARRSEAPEVYMASSALRRARKKSVNADSDVTHAALRERDGDHCCYCGVVMSFAPGVLGVWVANKASIEHIVPLSRGGKHSFDNTALACLQCNVRKHNKTVDEWRVVSA